MSQPSTNWESFAIQIPGVDLLEPVRAILEVLVIFLEILKTLLETVKILLILFANLIIALVEALIALILALFEALKRSGLYIWWDIPDLSKDPNLNRNYGGYQAFLTRFKGSCVDTKDPNRPQPLAGVTESGFLLLVIDADIPVNLIRLIMILMYFFGQNIKMPHYKAPQNLKVLPIGDSGPVLTLTDLFSQRPQSLVLQWSLSGRQVSGDSGQQPIFQDFAAELIPSFFVIEKSLVNPNQNIDVSQLSNPQAAGMVTMSVPTNFEQNGQPGATVMKTISVPDFWNDPFIKFQQYIAVNPLTSIGTFLAGPLGTFSYVDNDVVPGKTYWYRVRAASGILSIDLQINGDNSVSFPPPVKNPLVGSSGSAGYTIVYPGDNPTAIVGKASPIHSATVPMFPTGNFDVIANLVALFETAFSLNFHLPLPAGATFSSGGEAIPPTTNSEIGLGSLTQLAGALTAYTAVPILGKAAGVGALASNFSPNPATGNLPQAPWQTYSVTSAANRLALKVSAGLIAANSVPAFQTYMTGPFHAVPTPGIGGPSLAAATSISEFVLGFTTVSSDVPTMQAALTAYGNLFGDPGTRLNVLGAVNYCKTFLMAGVPPDWKSVQLLRDIIPWAGQLLNELIAKIQALLDAFKGLMGEIIAFINLIERKITVLEQFIEYLISILQFLLTLEIGLFVLFLAETSGDITSWFAAIDGAGGSPPTSGPTGYTGGVALAYIAPDVTAFAAALSLIF